MSFHVASKCSVWRFDREGLRQVQNWMMNHLEWFFLDDQGCQRMTCRFNCHFNAKFRSSQASSGIQLYINSSKPNIFHDIIFDIVEAHFYVVPTAE